MQVTTLVEFDDKKAGVRRFVGDVFVVSKARFAEINKVGMENIAKPLVEEIEPKKAGKGAR